ncbi:hypothetical protein LJ707_08670 [Mucilaginibacter sp. UR6-1]|uniref:hypothetical protein n=1 Tax=Mucilaginibacter sp. UR6-1 TaxID=1435643 RepID=UPI001E4B557C|nr:hypothetical protein [Mucilaginibacter sp. UR6-1]MCC8409001.1 hypothetical protein [Mucilaginibacter sp. UR6-1]
MKTCKLSLLIIAFLLSTNWGFGQSKATEAQTFQYLESTIKLLIGKKIYTDGDVTVITNVKCSNNSIVTMANYKEDGSTDFVDIKSTVSEIPWHTFKSIKVADSYELTNEDLMILTINFTSNLKRVLVTDGISDKPDYEDSFDIIFPKDRRQSVEKAISRLVEIYKSKNQDPFQ